jgi:hypothetical protein
MPSSTASSSVLGLGRDGHHLAGENAGIPCPGRPAMALERIGVHVLAGDPVAVGQHLGDPELGPQPPVNRREEGRGERPGPPPGIARHRHPAHRLDAAGHHQVVVAGHHAGGGKVHGLLGGPALPVHRGGRDVLRQPGRHPGVAGHIGALLPDLGDAAADDVVDRRRVDAGPVEQGGDGESEEVGRVPVLERAAPFAECGPHHVDDDRVTASGGCAHDGRPTTAGLTTAGLTTAGLILVPPGRPVPPVPLERD